MRLAEAVVMRIAYLIAKDDPDELAHYLKACLPAGLPLDPVREALGTLRPEFRALAREVAPWLAEESLEAPTGELIVSALAKAGAAGLTLSDLRLEKRRDRGQVLEALIRSGRVIREHVRTGGRPADRFRLAENAAGVVPADHDNPFAFRPAPLFEG